MPLGKGIEMLGKVKVIAPGRLVPSLPTGRGRVDVAGLAVGLTSGIVVIVLAGLGAFWYLHYRRRRHLRVRESCQQE